MDGKNLKNKQKECNNLDISLRGASIAPSSRESVTYLVLLASVNALTDKSYLLTCSGVSSTNITCIAVAYVNTHEYNYTDNTRFIRQLFPLLLLILLEGLSLPYCAFV